MPLGVNTNAKINSFDPENQNPQTLQTGAYALEELVNDFESAYEDGEALLEDSINTQLISKSKSLFNLYPKEKLKTFANFKLSDFSKKHSLDERETSALVATTDLFIKTDEELAETIFEHRITRNWLSIFHANRTIKKVKIPGYCKICT